MKVIELGPAEMQVLAERIRAEKSYEEAAESFSRVVEQYGPQSPETETEAQRLQACLEAYIASLA